MKKSGLALLALALTVFLTAGTSLAATWTVCGSGCSSTTINGAIGLASDGDKIIVKPGTYTGTVVVNKSLQILSTGGKLKTFVVSPAIGNPGFLVLGTANVLIQGFTIRGGTSAPGVFIAANNVRVRYCTVEKSGWGILIASPAANVKLSYNQVRYNTKMSGGIAAGAGIYVAGSGVSIPNVIMSYNQINDNDWFGVLTLGSPGAIDIGGMKLNYNTLVNNGSVDLSAPSNNNLFGVVFDNSSGAVAMNYNKFLDAVSSEILLFGATTPTLTKVGNVRYPNFKDALLGAATSIP